MPGDRLTLRREFARKALHLLTVVVPLAYAAGLPRRWLIVFLLAVNATALAVEWGRASHVAMKTLFSRATGILLRAHEHEQWAAATWLLLAFLGAVVLLPRDVAIAAMWAVAIGDAAAALAGRVFGGQRIGGSSKTIQGSAVCFATTLAGAVLVARLSLDEGLIAAATATLAEWPEKPFDDNIRIAVSVGCGILLWRIAFS